MDRWARACDLPLVTCVAGEAFGPWQPQTSLMARLVAHLMHERAFAIPDGGEIVRDWLPIRDLAAGLLCAAEAPRRRYRASISPSAPNAATSTSPNPSAPCSTSASPRAAGRWMDLISCEGDAGARLLARCWIRWKPSSDLGWQPQGFHAGLDRLLSWALASRAAVQARTHAVAAE